MKEESENKQADKFEKIVDILIRLGVLLLLLNWCYSIIKPFVLTLIWSAVIAIAVYPLHLILVKVLRGREILTICFLVFLLLSVIIVPSVLVGESLYDGVNYIRDQMDSGQHLIPPPGDIVKTWPKFTQPLIDLWASASDNLQATVKQYSAELTTGGSWILSTFADIGKSILQFNISIIIAGFLLAYSESLKEAAKKIFVKLAGSNGENFADVTVKTIRNVVKGFIGVALIQAVMAGLGFFVAGVPFAGFWAVACLVLAIVQIGIGPIAIPIVVYMFSVSDTTTAVILAIWLVFTMLSDNVLKPLLLGKNSPAPMPIVFLGAVGGFMFNGFLGLFLGAVILSIAYKLFLGWMNSDNA